MNLVKVGRSKVEQDGHMDRIGRHAKRQNYTDTYIVGNCIANAGKCRSGVDSATGYADTEGEPFKAYYCAQCAARLCGLVA